MRLGNVRFGDAVHEQPLLSRFAVRPLGYADERHIAEAECFELLMNLVDLSQSSINEQQVRRGDLAVLDPHIAPFERLAQRSVVIPRCHPCDVESAVFFLERSFRAEDYTGSYSPLAARMADVETLDACRGFRKIQLG